MSEESIKELDLFYKTARVINSCITKEHFRVALNYISLAKNILGEDDTSILLDIFAQKVREENM